MITHSRYSIADVVRVLAVAVPFLITPLLSATAPREAAEHRGLLKGAGCRPSLECSIQNGEQPGKRIAFTFRL
jgi:hypothetical protein